MKVRAPFDAGSLVVIALTLLLFTWALFEKGLTHDILLEAGVFMISVKLIIMSYKNSLVAATIDAKLDRIAAELAGRRPGAVDPGRSSASGADPRPGGDGA